MQTSEKIRKSRTTSSSKRQPYNKRYPTTGETDQLANQQQEQQKLKELLVHVNAISHCTRHPLLVPSIKRRTKLAGHVTSRYYHRSKATTKWRERHEPVASSRNIQRFQSSQSALTSSFKYLSGYLVSTTFAQTIKQPAPWCHCTRKRRVYKSSRYIRRGASLKAVLSFSDVEEK